ncbi:MAG: RidA family protein [Eubacterium sp.]|nr:RidA family protein [Eubacterium sp.]
MKKEIINPDTVVTPVAPYATLVKTSEMKGMAFLAGQVASDVENHILCVGDIAGQAAVVAENIKKCLAAAGLGPEHVVSTTTYIIESVREAYFETGAFKVILEAFDHPADTLIGVAALNGSERGVLMEVSAIAVY